LSFVTRRDSEVVVVSIVDCRSSDSYFTTTRTTTNNMQLLSLARNAATAAAAVAVAVVVALLTASEKMVEYCDTWRAALVAAAQNVCHLLWVAYEEFVVVLVRGISHCREADEAGGAECHGHAAVADAETVRHRSWNYTSTSHSALEIFGAT
jgi:H+/Cl- antiporter ClcA